MARLLIEMGADVNELDNFEQSPLMNHFGISEPNLSVISVLLEKGANLMFVNSRGDNLFSKCPNDFGMFYFYRYLTEELFKFILENGSLVLEILSLISLVFNSFPTYQAIFESNLPVHLCALKDAADSEYVAQLSDSEFLSFVKNAIARNNCLPFLI